MYALHETKPSRFYKAYIQITVQARSIWSYPLFGVSPNISPIHKEDYLIVFFQWSI